MNTKSFGYYGWPLLLGVMYFSLALLISLLLRDWFNAPVLQRLEAIEKRLDQLQAMQTPANNSKL